MRNAIKTVYAGEAQALYSSSRKQSKMVSMAVLYTPMIAHATTAAPNCSSAHHCVSYLLVQYSAQTHLFRAHPSFGYYEALQFFRTLSLRQVLMYIDATPGHVNCAAACMLRIDNKQCHASALFAAKIHTI